MPPAVERGGAREDRDAGGGVAFAQVDLAMHWGVCSRRFHAGSLTGGLGASAQAGAVRLGVLQGVVAIGLEPGADCVSGGAGGSSGCERDLALRVDQGGSRQRRHTVPVLAAAEDAAQGEEWHRQGRSRSDPGGVDIGLRPKVVEAKSRIGDSEVDLIISNGHHGAVLSVQTRPSMARRPPL